MSKDFVVHGGVLLLPPCQIARYRVVVSLWTKRSGGLDFLKTAAGICILSARKQPALQRFFSFPVGRGRMTSYFDLVIYSMVSIESTILIFEIFRKGIAVANKQAPTAKRVASRIDRTGIATS